MNLPWHNDIVSSVSNLKSGGTLPHAIMLSGGDGLGAGILAQRLAAYLLCETPMGNDACGTCRGCTLFEAGSHNDFIQLSPEEGKAQIKVDEVRVLVEFITESSMRNGYKVAVIDPVEGLNINGANALLKTLEEPAGNTVIFLVAQRQEAILPTIRSRCQILSLHSPSEEQAIDWLAQNSGTANEELALYLRISGGEPLRALRYIEQDSVQLQREMIANLGLVLKRKMAVSELAVLWADDLKMDRLEWLIQWVEQMVRYVSTNDDNVFALPESITMLAYLAAKPDIQQLFDLRHTHVEQLRLLKGTTNPNPTLLFEALLIAWLGLM